MSGSAEFKELKGDSKGHKASGSMKKRSFPEKGMDFVFCPAREEVTFPPNDFDRTHNVDLVDLEDLEQKIQTDVLTRLDLSRATIADPSGKPKQFARFYNSDVVCSMVRLSDGILATADDKGKVKLWSRATCLEPDDTLNTVGDHVTALEGFGRRLTSGNENGTIKSWELHERDREEDRCVQTLVGHQGSVRALLMYENGVLISGSDDRTIKIWKTTYWLSQRGGFGGGWTLKGHTGSVYALAMLSKNNFASASVDKTIKIWDLGTRECTRTLKGHSGPIRALVVLPRGTLASGSDDKTIRIWNTETGKCVHVLKGHLGGIHALQEMQWGTLASASDDKTVKIWDIATGKCVHTLAEHLGSVRALANLGVSLVLASASSNRVHFWDLLPQRALSLAELTSIMRCLKANRSVRHLDLSNTPLEDKNIPMLIEIVWNNMNLDYLNISNTQVTKEGLRKFYEEIQWRMYDKDDDEDVDTGKVVIECSSDEMGSSREEIGENSDSSLRRGPPFAIGLSYSDIQSHEGLEAFRFDLTEKLIPIFLVYKQLNTGLVQGSKDNFQKGSQAISDLTGSIPFVGGMVKTAVKAGAALLGMKHENDVRKRITRISEMIPSETLQEDIARAVRHFCLLILDQSPKETASLTKEEGREIARRFFKHLNAFWESDQFEAGILILTSSGAQGGEHKEASPRREHKETSSQPVQNSLFCCMITCVANYYGKDLKSSAPDFRIFPETLLVKQPHLFYGFTMSVPGPVPLSASSSPYGEVPIVLGYSGVQFAPAPQHRAVYPGYVPGMSTPSALPPSDRASTFTGAQ